MNLNYEGKREKFGYRNAPASQCKNIGSVPAAGAEIGDESSFIVARLSAETIEELRNVTNRLSHEKL